MAIDNSFEMGTLLPAAHIAGELHGIARTLRLFDRAVTPEQIHKVA
jgi:hypothetical protein